LSVSLTLIQIYCTVLYCPPFCSVVLFMPPPQYPHLKLTLGLRPGHVQYLNNMIHGQNLSSTSGEPEFVA
jgi:hypothetical protein